MSYIDYLNAFDRWLETNYLSASAQLMYIKLLMLFNRVGWTNSVTVDNRRLAMMINTTEKSAINARDELVNFNFITYEKGKKGKPNRYQLVQKVLNKVLNNHKILCNDYSINDSISDSISDSINDSTKGSHNKTKKKTKIKSSCSSELNKDFFDGNDDEENTFSLWGENQRVMLTENQVGLLLEKMELEEFNYYIDKLDSFICDKNAKVKSHYNTILKWWTADKQI